MGVPIRVINDDCVSSSEVDAKAAGASGQQEDKHVGVSVEGSHGLLAVLPGNAAIDARGRVAQLLHVRVQDVEHLCHLRARRIQQIVNACVVALQYLTSVFGQR